MENTSFWKTWARALGEKIGEDSRRADKVAWILTFIVLQVVICKIFIVINIILHWIED